MTNLRWPISVLYFMPNQVTCCCRSQSKPREPFVSGRHAVTSTDTALPKYQSFRLYSNRHTQDVIAKGFDKVFSSHKMLGVHPCSSSRAHETCDSGSTKQRRATTSTKHQEKAGTKHRHVPGSMQNQKVWAQILGFGCSHRMWSVAGIHVNAYSQENYW